MQDYCLRFPSRFNSPTNCTPSMLGKDIPASALTWPLDFDPCEPNSLLISRVETWTEPLKSLLMSDFTKWAFDTFTNLELIAIGDFSCRGRFRKYNNVLQRIGNEKDTEYGEKGWRRMDDRKRQDYGLPFRILDMRERKDLGLWEKLDKERDGYDMLDACPVYCA